MTIPKLKPIHKLLLLTVTVTLITLGYYLRMLNSTPPAPTTPNPLITPPALSANQTTSQRLIIDWQDKQYQGPQSVALLTVKDTLIDPKTILDLSSKLGFNNSHEIDTKRADSYLWVSGQKSLSATTPKGPLTYQNLTLRPTGNFKTKDEVLAIAIKSLDDLLDISQVSFIPNTEIETFSYNTTNIALEPTIVDKSQFASLFFYQTLDTIPYLPPTPNNAIIRLTINTKGEVRSLEITAGIRTFETSSPQTLKDFNRLKATAQTTARRLTLNNNIEEESDILSLPTVHLKVENIDLVYTSNFKDNIIQPVYRISGRYTTEQVKGIPVSYLIPAL